MTIASCKHGVGAFQPCRECDDETDKAAILAERDEARVMADKLTAELAACAAALPGVYYMDSPDGGDVPVSEQLRRMAKDAERYRLLRRKFAIISDLEGHAEFCAINLPRPTYIAPSSAIELDTALDRERLGLDGARPSTPAAQPAPPSEAMIKAGNDMASLLMDVSVAVGMNGLGGSITTEEWHALEVPNKDMAEQYARKEIDSVTAIYIAMRRATPSEEK